MILVDKYDKDISIHKVMQSRIAHEEKHIYHKKVIASRPNVFEREKRFQGLGINVEDYRYILERQRVHSMAAMPRSNDQVFGAYMEDL